MAKRGKATDTHAAAGTDDYKFLSGMIALASFRDKGSRRIIPTFDEAVDIMNIIMDGIAETMLNGSRVDARRWILAAVSAQERPIIDLLLKKPGRGREPKTVGVVARKNAARREVYTWEKSENPMLPDEEIAKKLGISLSTLQRALGKRS
jgi:DNA invertase Pin-like site-specific DNA recombinase